MTGLSWPATAAAGALWLIIYFTTRTVSIASLAAAVALPAGVAAFGQLGLAAGYGAVLGFAVLLALIIIVRHRTNIARLLRGEELGFRKETAVGAASAGEGGAPAHGNSAVSGGFQGEKQ
jgi:glycerol-3-phosphate acyltransferase PlsY